MLLSKLKDNKSIGIIELTRNSYTQLSSSLHYDFLVEIHNLKSIILEYCYIDDEQVECIINSLQNGCLLKKLCVSNNKITVHAYIEYRNAADWRKPQFIDVT